MKRPESQDRKPPGVEAFMGVVFAGVGIAFLVHVNSMMGGFGAPPPFFRLVFSLISIAFVAGGGAAVWKAVQALGGQAPESSFRSEPISAPPEAPVGPTASPVVHYTCPHCGASLTDGADVSPHGDVKCGYCTSWFNIHQA